jgi:hypothetical protein
MLFIYEGNRGKMAIGNALLRLPGLAIITGEQNDPTRSDRPGKPTSKGKTVERGLDSLSGYKPIRAAINGAKNCSVSSDSDSAFRISECD